VGVVKKGGYAELILIDVKLLADLVLVENLHKNIVVIMKDGVIYKNEL